MTMEPLSAKTAASLNQSSSPAVGSSSLAKKSSGQQSNKISTRSTSTNPSKRQISPVPFAAATSFQQRQQQQQQQKQDQEKEEFRHLGVLVTDNVRELLAEQQQATVAEFKGVKSSIVEAQNALETFSGRFDSHNQGMVQSMASVQQSMDHRFEEIYKMLAEQMHQKEQELSAVRGEFAAFAGKHECLQKEYHDYQQEASLRYTKLQAEHEISQQEFAKLKSENDALHEEVADITGQRDQAIAHRQELEIQHASAHDEFERLQREHSEALERLDTVQEEFEVERAVHEGLMKSKHSLEEAIVTLREEKEEEFQAAKQTWETAKDSLEQRNKEAWEMLERQEAEVRNLKAAGHHVDPMMQTQPSKRGCKLSLDEARRQAKKASCSSGVDQARLEELQTCVYGTTTNQH